MDDVQENRVSTAPRFSIIFALALLFIMLTSVTETFSTKNDSIDISIVNSSFVPLSNTDANQIKAYVGYTLEDDKMQNQLVNAVMEVYASNGTLIRTTSIGGGFAVNPNV